MTTIKFAKVTENAKIPTKRVEDAGYDIYACFEEDYMVIKAHETKMIPTGIASVCDNDWCIVLKERGSTGSKGLGLRCGIIDSSYRGEYFVAITNHNDFDYAIVKEGKKVEEPFYSYGGKEYPYTKAICQGLVIPVPNVQIEEISYEELQAIPSERGTGKLGSSNK